MKLFLQSLLHGLYSSRIHFAVIILFCLLISPIKAQNVSCSVSNKVYVTSGQTGKARVLLNNWEQNYQVNSISYTLYFNGATSEERNVELPKPLTYYENISIDIEIPSADRLGVDAFSVTIVKVNGQPNRNGFATSGSERFTLSRAVWRKAVVEELTSMYCHHCPSGIASLERLNHVAPDRVIGLAAHSDDALGAGDYYQVFREFTGRPKIILNGRNVVSPYMGNSGTSKNSFGLLTDVEQVSGFQQSPVELKVQAAWSADRKSIEVRSATTFRCPIEKNKYRLAYALTADNLKAPSFLQYNNYSGDPDWANSVPEMQFFYKADRVVRGMAYNDVVIAAKDIHRGMQGSLPERIQLDTPFEHTHHFENFSFSRGFRFVKKDTKVHAVVIVIDPETREIINAERCVVGDRIDPFPQDPVPNPNVQKIILPESQTQQLNNEFTLQPQISPKEATSPIVWEVADNTIISSLGGGKFRAIKPGKTTITARAQDAGAATAQCVVTVLAPNVARIELPENLTQALNSDFSLQVKTFPQEATSAIAWEVADSKIVESLGGGKFRALKVGVTTITARAKDAGGVIAKCVVRVPAPNIARIELPTKLTQPLNSEFTLQARTFPREATSAIVWEVADSKIVESIGGGKFRALKVGETTITARAKDAGRVTAKCVVRVPAPNVARIEMPANLTQPLNSEFTLQAKTFPQEATSAIVWEVADSKIVASLGGGKFRALKVGETTITARAKDADGVTAKCVVRVPVPNIERIELPANLTQPLNSEFSLQARTFPQEATSAIVWEVADAKIVASLGGGKFRALKVGETTITARAKDAGGVTAKCVVRVPAPNVARIEIPATLTQPLNSEFSLQAKTFPQEATSDIAWEVTDSKIIASLGGGKFRALKVGETTITARAKDAGGVTAKCVVRVPAPNVARIEMPANLTQPLNSEFSLQAKTFPLEATSAIVWEVADAKIIESLGGGKFRALKVGETTITARAQDTGDATAQCVVRVPAPNVARIEMPATLTQPLNSEFTLTTKTFPLEATSAIVWEVADSKIVASLGGGKFRVLKVGETTITARAKDAGGVTAKCVITVTAPTAIVSHTISLVVHRNNTMLLIEDAPAGLPVVVYDLLGRKLACGCTNAPTTRLHVGDSPLWIVVVGNKIYRLKQ